MRNQHVRAFHGFRPTFCILGRENQSIQAVTGRDAWTHGTSLNSTKQLRDCPMEGINVSERKKKKKSAPAQPQIRTELGKIKHGKV